MTPATLRWLRRALSAAAFWSALGLLFALPRLVDGVPLRPLLPLSLAEWWAWGMLMPAIVALDRRLPLRERQTGRRLVYHLALGLAVTAVYVYLQTLLAALLQAAPWSALTGSAPLRTALRGGFLWALLVYGLIVGSSWAYQAQQRYTTAALNLERLERNYAEARLNALRLQLDPHFLFNALNTISAQVQSEPKLARKMIEHLGDLLRLSLDPRSRHEIALADELDFLDHYLAIQKIRFGDQLRIELAIGADVRGAAVPSLFLQPLVENAIRHGISKRAQGGTIRVTAERRAGLLEIRVRDDGVGLPPGWSLERRAGLGLHVTRERIAGFHAPGSCRFTVEAGVGGGTEVNLAFPWRLMEQTHERTGT